jgi:hypothetical protein
MWRGRNTNRKSGLEAQLRSYRVEPRDEFVTKLSQETVAARPMPRRARSRVAFAGAVSTFILGTFASFGGLGYAATGAAGAYHAAKQATSGHVLLSVHKSSAADQYGPKPHKKTKPHKAQHAVTGVAGVQAAAVKSSGTLPFTGLSLLATFLVSLALIVGGIALRRREVKS